MTQLPLPPDTRILVIGCGVVGAALADELTELGMTAVTVVDQGPLYRTGGSSSHAPGFAFQTTGSAVMSELARRTLDKLDGLQLDGRWLIKRVGGLELACDPERLDYIHRRHTLAQSWGVPARMLSGAECAELFPGLAAEVILGGLHTPTDAVLKCERAIEWQARRAIAQGAVVYGHTEVTGIDIAEGRVRGVQVRPTPPVPGNPSRGPGLPAGVDYLPADIVVLCAGLWGPGIAETIGLELPMVPMEHTSAATTALPSLAGFDEDEELDRPMVRHQGTGSYFRQLGERVVWGSYEHRVIPVAPEQIATPEQFAASGVEPARHPQDWRDLADGWEVMHRLLPETQQTEPVDGYNGIFSFTPDGNPLLGEVPGIAGLWLGESVWLTQSAGVGQVLADWMVTGDPGIDTTELDFRRFDQRHWTRTVTLLRGAENYDRIYDVAHPRSQTAVLRGHSTSPFYLRQQAAGAVFGQSDGWERPLWYRGEHTGEAPDAWSARGWSPSISAEARAAIASAALFDAGPVHALQLRGSGAAGALTRLAGTETLPAAGHAAALSVPAAGGGVAAELTAVRTGAHEFLVLAGGHEPLWLVRAAAGTDVAIAELSAGCAALTVLGPRAPEVLAGLIRGHVDWAAHETAPLVDLAGVPVRLLPAPGTGLAGRTLLFDTQHGLHLWDRLAGTGQLTLAGDEAHRALRIAAGTPAFGVDYGPRALPGPLGFTMTPWLGRPRQLVQLQLQDARHAVLGGEPVLVGSEVGGYVTSAADNPLSGRTVIFAWLDLDAAGPGTLVHIGYLDQRYPARVIEPGGARPARRAVLETA